MSGGPRPTLRCSCSGRHLTEAFVYDAPPAGEVRFDLPTAQYARAYDRCSLCGHWFGRHAIDLAALYERGYVDATYGGPAGMRARLEQVLALPPERSDNAGRVARLIKGQSRVGAELCGRCATPGRGAMWPSHDSPARRRHAARDSRIRAGSRRPPAASFVDAPPSASTRAKKRFSSPFVRSGRST